MFQLAERFDAKLSIANVHCFIATDIWFNKENLGDAFLGIRTKINPSMAVLVVGSKLDHRNINNNLKVLNGEKYFYKILINILL